MDEVLVGASPRIRRPYCYKIFVRPSCHSTSLVRPKTEDVQPTHVAIVHRAKYGPCPNLPDQNVRNQIKSLREFKLAASKGCDQRPSCKRDVMSPGTTIWQYISLISSRVERSIHNIHIIREICFRQKVLLHPTDIGWIFGTWKPISTIFPYFSTIRQSKPLLRQPSFLA